MTGDRRRGREARSHPSFSFLPYDKRYHILIMIGIFPMRLISSGLLLLSTYAFLSAYAQCSERTCIRDPQHIIDAELLVNDTSNDRYYCLCMNSVLNIEQYNWTSKTYVNGTNLVRPLSIMLPNIHIYCGPYGNSRDNCTISGGTLQLEVVDASYYGGKSQKIKNASVRGVTFTNLGSMPDSANLYMFGSPQGAELLVKDCIFLNNKAIANIKFEDNYQSSVYIDGGIFKNNVLVDSTTSRNSGLVFSDLGGTIFVNNSLFINNTVSTSYSNGWYGLNAIINANDVAAKSEITSNINVVNSCFVQNKGITFSLVFGAMWGDAVMNSRNNYAHSNVYEQYRYKSCGIGQLYMNSYYDYFGYYNFSTGICQAKFDANSCSPFPNITASTPFTAFTPPSKKKHSVNMAAAVFVPLVLIFSGFAFLYFWRRKKLKKHRATPAAPVNLS